MTQNNEDYKSILLPKTLTVFYDTEGNGDFNALYKDLFQYREQQAKLIETQSIPIASSISSRSRPINQQSTTPYEEYEFNLYTSLQTLLLEAIAFNDKRQINYKLRRVKRWYNQTKSSYQSLQHLNIRTAREAYEIYPEEQVEEDEKEEEKNDYIAINPHRNFIEGFDSPANRLKEYDTKGIGKSLLRKNNIQYDKGTTNEASTHSGRYFKTGSTGFATQRDYKLHQSHRSMMTNKTLASSFKYNQLQYNTDSNRNINTNTNTNSNNSDAKSTSIITVIRPSIELKSSYSYMRPEANYKQLIIEQQINKEKQRTLADKLHTNQVNSILKLFGDKKALFNKHMTTKYELKEVIRKYKGGFKDNHHRVSINKDKELLEAYERYKGKQQRLKTEIRRSVDEKKGCKFNYEINKDKTIDAVLIKPKKKQSCIKAFTNFRLKPNETEDESKPKPKTNIDTVKYVSSVIDNYNNKVFNMKTTLAKTSTLIQNNKDIIKRQLEERDDSKPEIQLNPPADTVTHSNFNNEISRLRRLNGKMCGLKPIDDIKDEYYTSCRPLSLFDSSNIETMPVRLSSRNKLNSNSTSNLFGVLYDFYQKSSDDYLKLRKTISSFRKNKGEQLCHRRNLSEAKYDIKAAFAIWDNYPSDLPLNMLPQGNANLLSFDKISK